LILQCVLYNDIYIDVMLLCTIPITIIGIGSVGIIQLDWFIYLKKKTDFEITGKHYILKFLVMNFGIKH